MGPDKTYPPSVIIRDDLARPVQQSKYGTPGPKGAVRSETARMGFPHGQPPSAVGQTGPVNLQEADSATAEQLQGPFSGPALPFRKPEQPAVMAGELSRDTSQKILDVVFQPKIQQGPQQSPAQTETQTAADTPAQSPEPSPQAQININSDYWQGWADYYGGFPVHPSTQNDVEKYLIKSLDLPLTRLGLQKPEEIEDSISSFRRGGPSFDSIAPDVERIRNYGFGLYSRLAAATRADEDRAFLRSEAGQKVLRQYPALARPYEVAPDDLIKAKKQYRKNLRRTTGFQVEASTRQNPNPSQIYSPAKIGEFISDTTWAKISEAVEELELTADREAALYARLPVAIQAAYFSSPGIFFETGQPIPDVSEDIIANFDPRFLPSQEDPEYASKMEDIKARAASESADFQANIARALLRSVVLQQATFGNDDGNLSYLLNYAGALRHGTISAGGGKGDAPGFRLNYMRDEDFDDENVGYRNFYQYVSVGDLALLGDLVALMENNSKAGHILYQVKKSMEKGEGRHKTMVSAGGVTSAYEGLVNARAILGGPEAYDETARAIHIDTKEEGVENLELLRARNIRIIGQLMAEKEDLQKRMEALDKKVVEHHALSFRATAETLAERNRADAAETANMKWRQWISQALQSLLTINGVFRWRKVNEAIKGFLKTLGEPPQ